MKKILIVATAFCLAISASAFSPKKKTKTVVTPVLEQNFIQEFGDMPNVQWSEAPQNMIKATFKVDDQTADAYFDTDGKYVCTTTSIAKENLPLKLRMEMNKRLAAVSVNAILQTSTPEGTSYYIQGTDEKGTKIWKASADGNIEMFKKL